MHPSGATQILRVTPRWAKRYQRKGAKALDLWVPQRSGKGQSEHTASDNRFELEYGLTNNLTGYVYLKGMALDRFRRATKVLIVLPSLAVQLVLRNVHRISTAGDRVSALLRL